jgi:hypothetical protein
VEAGNVRFDRESYRKLYVRESAEDRMRPLFFRGLRDYLLRQAKDDGTLLANTKDPAADLGKALVAHPSERKLLKEYVTDLLASGYLSHESGRLWITRFQEAQEARSKGAIRQERYRNNKRVTSDGEDDATGDGPVTSPVTSPLADETRREITDETPLPPRLALVSCPKNLWDLLPEDAKSTLETAFIPRWAQEQICKGFAARTASKRGNERSVEAWCSTVIRVIQAEFQDPNRRPKRIDPAAADPAPAQRPKTWADIEREEAAAEAAKRAARP